MEEELYNLPPADAPEPWHPGGNGFYREPAYPYQAGYAAGTGQVYIKNPDYIIRLYDAVGFRMNDAGDIELLVRDPEGSTLVWYDITELEIPEPTNH